MENLNNNAEAVDSNINSEATNHGNTPVSPNLKNSFDKSQNRKSKSKGGGVFWQVIILMVVFYVGVAWGARVSGSAQEGEEGGFLKNLSSPGKIFSATDDSKPREVDFKVFWEAWRVLDQEYVDVEDLDAQERVYGAVDGMVDSLGDPHSNFLDPEETKNFNSEIEGSFEGIGAVLDMKDGVLMIVSPIEGMPAEKAGLKAGDKIIKINNESTVDLGIEEAVKKIRGKKGTEVTLTIIREGNGSEAKEIAITRDTIEIKSVEYEKKEGDLGYIKIKSFSEDTADEFRGAVAGALSDNNRGIILDLRNNPGGLLNVAVEITSEFVPSGEPVVWEEDREGNRNAYRADTKGFERPILVDFPVIVLINEGSASASEILAGALRDLRDTKLVGEKSFGKGSVQRLKSLQDGSSLKVTVAKWLTPSGGSIHKVGIEPDIKVERTLEDFENERDPQLDRAIEELKADIR